MAVAMVIDQPGGTREQYDQSVEKLRQRGVTPPVAGQLFHAAGPIDGAWRVMEVWESQEAADRFFREHLAAIFAEIGMTTDQMPQFFPVHALYK